VFAEFERGMIRERVMAGLKVFVPEPSSRDDDGEVRGSFTAVPIRWNKR
jgi:hypothetical protein